MCKSLVSFLLENNTVLCGSLCLEKSAGLPGEHRECISGGVFSTGDIKGTGSFSKENGPQRKM